MLLLLFLVWVMSSLLFFLVRGLPVCFLNESNLGFTDIFLIVFCFLYRWSDLNFISSTYFTSHLLCLFLLSFLMLKLRSFIFFDPPLVSLTTGWWLRKCYSAFQESQWFTPADTIATNLIPEVAPFPKFPVWLLSTSRGQGRNKIYPLFILLYFQHISDKSSPGI